MIPAKNEESSIEAVISDIRAHESEADIIVVNDDSVDQTPAVLARLKVQCLNHIESLGAWQATQTGLIFARMQGYSHIVTMDADGQHLGSEIKKLLNACKSENQPDVVVGACQGRASFSKRFVWSFFRKISGIKVQDVTSGFRLYNAKAVELLVSQRASLLEYQDVGVLLLLKSSGVRVTEVPVKMDKRFDGDSRIFSSWLKIFYYLVTTLIISISKIFQKQKGN